MTGLELDEPERAPAQDRPSTTAFLALFMLLLAFFILLNGVATREAGRTEALMRSLDATFGGGPGPPKKFGDALLLARDSFRAELGLLLERTLPEAAAAPDRRDGEIVVVAPLARIFREDSLEFHSRSRELLAGFAGLLASAGPGHRIELLASIGVDGAPTAAGDLQLRRAGALARELGRLGAPAGAVAVGLGAARPDRVAFAFDVRARDGAAP